MGLRFGGKVAMSSRGSLLRILGITFGIAVVVGGMVGQGILRTPGIIAGAVHSPELILALWATGALLAGLSAFAYIELATAIPCAGGPYDFVRRAFGPLAGVVTGWGAWLILITLEAFLGIVVAEFLHRLGVFTELPQPVVAIGVLALFWAVNLTSTRIAGDSQVILSAFKGAALIALIILLFSHPGSGVSAAGAEVAGPIGIAALAIAMRNVMNTYNGWDEVVYFGEEIKTPQRTLPRAIAIGIAGVAILYLLINLALLHVLSPAQMAGSKLVAADAMKIVMGPTGELATTIFAVISVAAITNLAMMKSARIGFALARSGDLPSKLATVASTGIPRWALSVSSLLAMVFAATGTYETVVAMNVAVGLVIVIAVNLAVMRLRRSEPDLARPFRMPWFPLPALLAIALNAVLLAALIYEDPFHSLSGLVALSLIAGIYLVIQREPRAQVA
jgi:APA family basic amino acid/polyamine antiporter